jgi:cupin 2 domain-containing protein
MMSEPKTNIFELPPKGARVGELVETLAEGPATRVERIISRGQVSPPGFWYDQPQDEWVVLLQGAARLRFDDETTAQLGAGDAILIPAHRRHRIERTSSAPPCIWIAVHGALRSS